MIFFEHIEWERLPQLLSLVVDGLEFRLRPLHTGVERQPRARTARRYNVHSHAVYHIVLYRSGGGLIEVAGEPVRIEPRTLVLTGPGDSHHFHPRSTHAFEYVEMTFSFESRDGIRAHLSFHQVLAALFGLDRVSGTLHRRLSVSQSSRLVSMLERFETLAGFPDGGGTVSSYQVLTAAFSFLLEEVLETKLERGRANRTDQAAVTAHDFIEANVGRSFRVGDVAGQVGMSERQLQRRFKAVYGMGVMGFRAECRLRHARQMLRESGLRINEISERLGFSSPYYFSTFFRRHTGVPPKEYRGGRVERDVCAGLG